VRLQFTPHFIRDYSRAPLKIQQAFDKQSLLLLQNLRHASLRAKKYNESEDKWQARVNQGWRFYFRIVDDAYIVTGIIPHPK
jgi:hypothetical protein